MFGWPQHPLTVPNNKVEWTRQRDGFPESLIEEVGSFLDADSNADRFDERGPRRALAAETIRGRRYQLQCYCSALVLTGTTPEELTNLWVLVQPETVKRGLNYFLDHYTTEKSVYRIAQLLRVIARDHLRLDDDHVKELTRLCKCLTPEPPGMKDKNRERLRQFNDPKYVLMLLDFPARLLRKAKRLNQGRRNDAVLVQLALAIEILLVAPLSLESHIQWSRAGRDGVVHLVIEAAEEKNRQALEYALPQESRELLKLYIEQYRPRLTNADNPWLFPGRGNGHKVPAVAGAGFALCDLIFGNKT